MEVLSRHNMFQHSAFSRRGLFPCLAHMKFMSPTERCQQIHLPYGKANIRVHIKRKKLSNAERSFIIPHGLV